MKQTLIGLCLLIAIILISCNKPNDIYFNRYTEEINTITFDYLNIQKEDYNKINNLLNNIKFSNKKLSTTKLINTIKIITIEDNIYNFYLYSNNTVRYNYNNKNYYSNYDINSIVKIFEDINKKYKDTTFFDINYYGSYENNNDKALVIDLENINSVFEFKSKQDINNFKIYNIEYNNNQFDTKELLYSKKKISKNTLILIKKTLAEGAPNFKITWDTPYNYQIELIPTYNGKDGGINLIKTIKEIK
jgi:hypothetical protein